MATTIQRHPEAFTGSGGKKRPREHDKDHLKFLAGLPCIVTGKRPVEVAHVRYADPIYGKPDTGGQEKPSDKWCVPLHVDEHRKQHTMNEKAYWNSVGIDPLSVASKLYMCTGDDEQAETIIRLIARK